jgi:hypothetical protein
MSTIKTAFNYEKEYSKGMKIWIDTVDFVETLVDNIKNGVENCYLWIKTIWVDKQWDDYFFLKIMKLKLTLMEKYFRHHGMSTESVKDADNIKRCITLLDRILNDNYSEEAFAEYNRKYKINNDDFDLASITKPIVDPTQQADFKSAIQIETDMKENDFNELFKIIRENIQSWWD